MGLIEVSIFCMENMENRENKAEPTNMELAFSYLYFQLTVSHAKRSEAVHSKKRTKISRLSDKIEQFNRAISQIENGDQAIINQYAPLEKLRRAELMA